MNRAEAQKLIRKSNIQSDVFSLLWGKVKNKDRTMRLKDIAAKLGRGSDRVLNAIEPMIRYGIVERESKGVYQVSRSVTK